MEAAEGGYAAKVAGNWKELTRIGYQRFLKASFSVMKC